MLNQWTWGKGRKSRVADQNIIHERQVLTIFQHHQTRAETSLTFQQKTHENAWKRIEHHWTIPTILANMATKDDKRDRTVWLGQELWQTFSCTRTLDPSRISRNLQPSAVLATRATQSHPCQVKAYQSLLVHRSHGRSPPHSQGLQILIFARQRNPKHQSQSKLSYIYLMPFVGSTKMRVVAGWYARRKKKTW